jgi:hypothetical protein
MDGISATMDLSQAYSLLKSTSTIDNARWFSDTYKEAGFGDADKVADYVEHILHDAHAWVDSFPMKVNALSTFKKPKTALTALLTCDAVAELLGAPQVTQVREAVEAVFNDKKFMKNVVKERKAAAPVTEAEAAPETADAQQDDLCRRLRHENEALRKALLSLASTIAGGDAITILALSLATV